MSSGPRSSQYGISTGKLAGNGFPDPPVEGRAAFVTAACAPPDDSIRMCPFVPSRIVEPEETAVSYTEKLKGAVKFRTSSSAELPGTSVPPAEIVAPVEDVNP